MLSHKKLQIHLEERNIQILEEVIRKLIVFMLLVAFIAINTTSVRNKSITYDEPHHYQYGENILNLNSDRFDDSKMPISAFNALPKKIGSLLPEGKIQSFLTKIQTGRMMTIVFSSGIAFLIFHWSQKLYGFFAGLLALFLYIFDPNIIAHSQLITTDIYITGMITLALYTYWRFSIHRDWKHAIVFSIVLGLAQLTKYTGIYLYPLLLILILIQDAPRYTKIIAQRDIQQGKKYLKKAFIFGIFFLVTSILIINAGFLFNRTFTPMREYDFKSNLFQNIQDWLAPVESLPVPVPYPFIEGLDWVRARERSGEGVARIYLLGDLRQDDGFLGYYFYAYLLKVPLASQIIVILAIIAMIKNNKDHQLLRNEVVLIWPMLFFAVYFNFFFKTQIGIRYYLVIFPFLYVFCGSLFNNWNTYNLKSKISFGFLIIYLVTSVLSYFPHYLTYFNEIVYDRKSAYKYLADSNIDWGQSALYLSQHLYDNPEIKYEPDQITVGTIAVSINNLVGVTEDPITFQWLREHFEPIYTIGNSYLIYEVTQEDYDRIWGNPSIGNNEN